VGAVHELGRRGCPGAVPCRSTVYRVLVRHGLIDPVPRRNSRSRPSAPPAPIWTRSPRSSTASPNRAATAAVPHLPTWINTAREAPFVEIRHLANGLVNDVDAVTAGLTESWSSGAVEGHVNRVKTIKRQTYDRAKFDLLRKRVLLPT
jgi:hypothetical protein